jgi:hypothetical protein
VIDRDDGRSAPRLDALVDGTRADDIVLTHPDQAHRWRATAGHFEL